MKLYLIPAAAILSAALAAPALADSSTPTSVPTLPPSTVVAADTPVASSTAPSSPEAAATTPTPGITVAREHSTPIVQVTQPSGTETGSQTSSNSTDSGPSPNGSASLGSFPSSTLSGRSGPPLSATSSALYPGVSGTAPSLSGYSAAAPVYAPAPAQLTCHGAAKPTSPPFLVSPFSGWTEVASFLDHDKPDYEIDGKIVLANGLTAISSNGSSADSFPAYWSSVLRQYINYDGHNGYDFEISYQPVLAAAAGTVSFAGWNSSDPSAGYGQMILIKHRYGYVTLYGHLSQLLVKKGDRVSAGQEIAVSGTTGNSSGPHLHFSVFHNCQVTDPYGWTGRGADPLQAFDGERSSYLWLPGGDPLLVNPPPNWPAYPSGLPSAVHGGIERDSAQLPSTDRLLLLSLPDPVSHRLSPGFAMARTEAAVAVEAQTLQVALDNLAHEKLITAYQFLPAAGAFWIRGSVASSQLESLPGVASLAGVLSQDVFAAQQGLAHAVLVQIAHQAPASLWPLGFRSSIEAWRPMVTVIDGSGFIAGWGSPGADIALSLKRGGTVEGSANVLTDPDNGGFVAVLHDASGNEVPARAGDVVQIQMDGRETSVPVRGLRVRARTDVITGDGEGALNLDTGSFDRGDIASRAVSPSKGRYRVSLMHPLSVGTLAVITGIDSAGNHEASASTVPGIKIDVGSALINGWVSGDAPSLMLKRRGQLLVRVNLHQQVDGAFQVDLTQHARQIPVSPGDVITIGSAAHHRTFTVPRLTIRFDGSGSNLALHGQPGLHVSVTESVAGGAQQSKHVTLDEHGNLNLAWIGQQVQNGDTAVASLSTSTGDTVQAAAVKQHFVLNEKTAEVYGWSRPGVVVVIKARDAHNRPLGEAVLGASPESGYFDAALRDGSGKPVRLEAGMRLVLSPDGSPVRVVLPRISSSSVARASQLSVTQGLFTYAITRAVANRKTKCSRSSSSKSGLKACSKRAKH